MRPTFVLVSTLISYAFSSSSYMGDGDGYNYMMSSEDLVFNSPSMVSMSEFPIRRRTFEAFPQEMNRLPRAHRIVFRSRPSTREYMNRQPLLRKFAMLRQNKRAKFNAATRDYGSSETNYENTSYENNSEQYVTLPTNYDGQTNETPSPYGNSENYTPDSQPTPPVYPPSPPSLPLSPPGPPGSPSYGYQGGNYGNSPGSSTEYRRKYRVHYP